MSYWAKAEIDRDQIALIPTTLSDRIPEDHSVRLFWELLGTYEWRLWESRYCGCYGHPVPFEPGDDELGDLISGELSEVSWRVPVFRLLIVARGYQRSFVRR